MADKVTKIIEVELSATETVKGMVQLTEALSNNKKTLKELEVEYKAGQMTSSEYAQAQVEIKTQNKILNDQLRTFQTAIVNNIKQEQAEIGSLNQLRAAYNSGKAALAAMSEEERNSAEGQELIESLRAQKAAITEAEESIGDYTGNVGNYQNALTSLLPVNSQMVTSIMSMSKGADGASGSVKALTTNIKSMTTATLKFLATPIGVALAAGAAAIKLIKDRIDDTNKSIEESERLTNLYTNASTKAQTAEILHTQVMQKQASSWLDFKKVLSDVNALWVRWNHNISKSKFDEMNEKVDGYNKRLQALDKTKREFVVQEAEIQKQISELQEKSKNQEEYSNKERKAFIQEAMELNEQLGESRRVLAQEEYDIYSQGISFSDSTTEELNKQAELKANIINVDKQVADSNKSMQRTVQETTNAIIAENKAFADQIVAEEKAKQAAEEAAEAKKKAAEESLKASQEDLYQLTVSMQEKSAESEKEALKHQTELAIEEIETRLSEEANITKAEREVLAATIVALREKQAADELAISQKYSKEELTKRIADKQQEWDTLAKEAKAAALKIDPNAYASPEDLKRAQEDASKAIIDAKMSELEETFKSLQELTEEEQKLLYESVADYNEAVLDAEIAYNSERNKLSEARIKAEEKEAAAVVKIRQATTTSVASSLGTLSSAISSINDENREAVIASQTLALAEVAINEGVAIAAATAEGSKLPPPYNFIAIAASVANIVAQMVSAASTIKSASFSTGGYVSGEGTSTSDSIPANLSNGEYVVNAAAVSALGVDTLDAINSANTSSSWVGSMLSVMGLSTGSQIDTSILSGVGNSASTLKEALKEALREMPSPTVSVVDINTEQKATRVRDNIAKLK
ncbi:MAG: hypothetical protein SNI51_02165 [Rikenellaceae bacterium]